MIKKLEDKDKQIHTIKSEEDGNEEDINEDKDVKIKEVDNIIQEKEIVNSEKMKEERKN